ncbi:MAG: hypothetical protein GXP63_01790 [DPANN group archaeon]|nr:hypothetical protein [DPANN group archaeon]
MNSIQTQARFHLSNTHISLIMSLFILAFFYFIYRSESDFLSYLIVILGLFLFMTFTLVSFYLIRNQLSYGIYASLAIASVLLVLQQINFQFLHDPTFHAVMMLGVLTLFMFIALFKLWLLLSNEN